jgi:hypothetical protein
MNPSVDSKSKISTKNNIKPLTCSKDYRIWTVRVTAKLQELSLWNINEKEPEPFDSEESNNLLLSLISDELLEQVIDTDLQASTIWKHFQKLYLVSSLSAQSTSLASLINFNFSAANMQDNKHEVLNLARELKTAFKNTAVITHEELIMLCCLVNLPSEYHSLRSTLAENNPNGLKFEALFESLLREEALSISANSAVANRAASKARAAKPTGQCSHNRLGSSCWSCHPNLRPVCGECKANGEVRFNHVKGSKFCKSNSSSTNNQLSYAQITKETSNAAAANA